MPRQTLETYLADHLGGSEAALALIDRWGPHLPDGAIRGLFSDLAVEVRADQETLDTIYQRVTHDTATSKRAAGWLAEKLLRMKLAFSDERHERFALFESLEILGLGLLGKRAMWSVLATLAARDARLKGLNYGVLELRAVNQHARVERARLDLALETLGPAPEPDVD